MILARICPWESPGAATRGGSNIWPRAEPGTPCSHMSTWATCHTSLRAHGQKVANYPGVTVERKEGFFVTPLGRQVSLVDLPGTYSLRGRSPDEEITRDMVLGRTPGGAVPH